MPDDVDDEGILSQMAEDERLRDLPEAFRPRQTSLSDGRPAHLKAYGYNDCLEATRAVEWRERALKAEAMMNVSPTRSRLSPRSTRRCRMPGDMSGSCCGHAVTVAEVQGSLRTVHVVDEDGEVDIECGCGCDQAQIDDLDHSIHDAYQNAEHERRQGRLRKVEPSP